MCHSERMVCGYEVLDYYEVMEALDPQNITFTDTQTLSTLLPAKAHVIFYKHKEMN